MQRTMRVLHLGGTGNLGRKVVNALLNHEHIVIAYVREQGKLIDILGEELTNRITIVEGDAFDTDRVARALRDYSCDAVVNTAGTSTGIYGRQTLGRLVQSITTAIINVGRERGKPLRAWIIGGMGSLKYPGTRYAIQDYMPAIMKEHHRTTEQVMKKISTQDLEWSLLCVAMMYNDPIEDRNSAGHSLIVSNDGSPAQWIDSWIRSVPLLGVYLNLVPVIASYSTPYLDVADFIAEDLASGCGQYIGKLVGFKKGSQRP